MKVSPRINSFRRNVMQSLTKHIGTSDSCSDFDNVDPDSIRRVLICRPNHRLGNLLLITPLVQEIEQRFPNARIDLFVKGGLAEVVFQNYSSIDRILKLPKRPFSSLFQYLSVWFKIKTRRYDVAINVDRKSSSGRLSTKIAKARFKFFGDNCDDIVAAQPDAKHIAKSPIYELRNGFCKTSVFPTVPKLDLRLSASELEHGKEALNRIFNNDKKTISIFTYATGKKCYETSWWDFFYDDLKSRYADTYNILEILPVENVSQIDFKAPSFYSKDVREIASVIANTEVFIGADSGIMHLASAAQTHTMGLFCVTDEKKYQPYNGRSLAVNTTCNAPKEWFNALQRILAPYFLILLETL